MGMPRIDVDARTAIRDAWVDLVREKPKLRQRDAAEALGVSEGELVASRCGDGVHRLRPQWRDLLSSLAALGPVKTITRNTWAVHETVGVYEDLTFVGDVALVQSEGLDLRLLLDRWASGFAVSDRTGNAIRHSIQFYDAAGLAVHKIYPEDGFDLAAFSALVQRFAAQDERKASNGSGAGAGRNGDETRGLSGSPGPARRLTSEERRALVDDWSRLEDTHDFGAMLVRHRIDRAAAMAAAEGVHTRRIGSASFGGALDRLRDAAVPVMVFVGNPGAVQIHTGVFGNVRRLGEWMNILDPHFNLHVVESGIDSLWIVTKPTRDGTITSIEAYAADGTEIAVLYGKRKPGIPELAAWREAVEAIRAAEVVS
jgi:putative hemin transport protein